MLRMLPRVLSLPRKLLLPLACGMVLAGTALPATAQEWAIDKSISKISFEVSAGGQTVTGEIKQFRAEIHFDPEDLGSADISAAIDMNNIKSGQPQIDDALLAKEWFDTQTYPTAGFRVGSVKAGRGEGDYVMNATITIKDISKEITLPFKVSINDGEASIKGETAIRRSDFGVGPMGPVSGVVVADVVKLKLDLAAKRLDN